jgi:small GTP-binding protein
MSVQASGNSLSKKVCMLGSYSVGKTSLVKRYVEGIFDEHYLTTVGVKIDRKRVVVGQTEVHLILWDLSGDDGIVRPRPSYFRGASGYLLVTDGCRRSTIAGALRMQEEAAFISGRVPVVTAVNKVDLKADWEFQPAEIEGLTGGEWPCIETSAKTGEGVEVLFQTLAQKMLQEAHDRTRPEI